jgi:hypothetical protein
MRALRAAAAGERLITISVCSSCSSSGGSSIETADWEHDLAKVGVEGSSPFARSSFFKVLAVPRKGAAFA